MPEVTRRAACSCGALSVVCAAEPVRVAVCHCLACQRRTGSVFGVQARFRREDVVIAGSSTTFVRAGDSGALLPFHFCPTCGATVYYELGPDFVGIPVGAFADPGFPGPVFSVYEARRHAWVELPGNVVRHE